MISNRILWWAVLSAALMTTVVGLVLAIQARRAEAAAVSLALFLMGAVLAFACAQALRLGKAPAERLIWVAIISGAVAVAIQIFFV